MHMRKNPLLYLEVVHIVSSTQCPIPRKLRPEHPHTIEIRTTLTELYEAWGEPEKAEEWRARLPQTETVETVGLILDS